MSKRYVITVKRGSEEFLLYAGNGTRLYDVLRASGFEINAPCGGNGRCGKCMTEIDGVMTKLCTFTVSGDHLVKLGAKDESELKSKPDYGGRIVDAAVDIGTTTVAIKVIDPSGELPPSELVMRNRQRSFGDDVISRITYSETEESALSTLRDTIRNQVREMIAELTGDKATLRHTVIAGNTIMSSFYEGISASSIARAPFIPESLFGYEWEGEYIARCVAGYVGGDITCGAFYCGLGRKDKIELLVDIGTNGEIVLCDRGRLMCCACAAGPAFEAATLSCGMYAGEGAIKSVKVTKGKMETETIGNASPKGICGSGIIDAVACMLDLGLIDETGRLLEREEIEGELSQYARGEGNDAVFFLSGDVYVSARDIREIQLAKAAIAAGIQTLLYKAGRTADELDTLYLAGGFGAAVNLESAVRIGLIPECGNTVPTGNSSLKGAEMLLNEDNREKTRFLAESMEYTELSHSREFMDYYVDNMEFI